VAVSSRRALAWLVLLAIVLAALLAVLGWLAWTTDLDGDAVAGTAVVVVVS
jgi:hypothetical protein